MADGGSNDRLMGIVIGVSISSGCIVICVIIILLRNRFALRRYAVFRKKHPLTFSSVSPWKKFRSVLNIKGIFKMN